MNNKDNLVVVEDAKDQKRIESNLRKAEEQNMASQQAYQQDMANRQRQQDALAQKRANINANANNIRNAANVAMATKNPYAVGIGGAVKAADKMTGGKSSEALGKVMDKGFKQAPLGGLAQKASNKLSESGASDAIGGAASMASDGATGSTNGNKATGSSGAAEGAAEIGLKKSTIWKWLLLASCCCVFVAFFIALISSVYELRLSSVIMGNMTAEDRNLLGDVISEIGRGDDRTSEVGMGDIDMSIYYERLAALGNVFSSDFECEKEDCSDRPEVRYYLKVADIALRYKNKYHVNLDWVLLNATMMYSDRDEEKTMERSLHDYNLDDVENYEILMDLDWDYDYKKIPGYKYLDPDDFRYDLQILAKNMVTKTTTQTCTKTVKNEDGTYSTIVTKSRTDIDIEAQYFEPGEAYYLKCDSGETYHITNDYKYDAEKYDEFLLEYLERKYYLPSDSENAPIGPGLDNYTPSTCIAQEFTKYALTDDQVAQLASLAYHEQGTAKGAAAEASLMANLFEIKGSKYGTGADGLYNYVRNGGWFANAPKNMDSYDASPEIISAVRSVLVDGKRTLPGYIDEHDWINDLTSVSNDGTEIDPKNRSSYKQHGTVIKNKYGATYTFYSFPDSNSDPFGYTSESRRKEIGEFHYDYDTGKAIDCSVSGNGLSGTLVNIALSQQGVSGRPNTYTKWYGSIENSYSYAWCATFVSWAIAQTEYEGQKLSDIIGYKTASVNYFAEHFMNSPNLKYVESAAYGGNYTPKQGDLIFFAWQDNGKCTYTGLWSMDHIGIVVEVKDGKVYTIEGNTSDSVATRSYDLNSCSVSSYGLWY